MEPKLFCVYSGTDFNKIYQGVKFYKLTFEDEIHNGYQFKDGLNIDNIPFSPEGSCQPGGIYFTEDKHFDHWNFSHTYYREVMIPNDAKVYVEDAKFKADKIILGPRKLISDRGKEQLKSLQMVPIKTGKRYFPQQLTQLW